MHDLVTAANRNLLHGFELLAEDMDGGALASFGTITAASSGLPIPNFNRLAVFDQPDPADLATAVDWMARRDVPFQVTVASPALETVRAEAAALDLEESVAQRVMAMSSLDDIPARDPPIPIETVQDEDDLRTFVDVSAAIFGFPVDVARALVTDTVLEAADLTFLIAVGETDGEADGEAVGCGQLTRSDDVAGVYTIGVREDYRRRGIATALSWEVLRRGRAAGCAVGVLQSSEMAVPVYEETGFETIETYHEFVPAE